MAKNDNSILCATLSYILIGIIWYFVDEAQRRDAFVQFHVRQAVVLLIVGVIVSILSGIIMWLPVIGWLISILLSLGMLVLWLIGIIGALTGKKNGIPIIEGFAKQLKF
jgi:uncharacterized membrane protein